MCLNTGGAPPDQHRVKSRHPGHEEEKSLKGASPLAKRCGAQALGFEPSFFRHTDEAMAAERFPTPRDQVRFLASVPCKPSRLHQSTRVTVQGCWTPNIRKRRSRWPGTAAAAEWLLTSVSTAEKDFSLHYMRTHAFVAKVVWRFPGAPPSWISCAQPVAVEADVW